MTEKKVHIVHCIDTEGPLYESLQATFERLYSVFKIRMKPNTENLERLQDMEVDLGGCEEAVAQMLGKSLLAYHDNWDKLDRMLYEILSEEYRRNILDSYGNGWVYNWFCVDHACRV
jgi:hypothetical protein